MIFLPFFSLCISRTVDLLGKPEVALNNLKHQEDAW
jgi:hypothetical protein